MIISHPAVRLDYDPATDIMFVVWPDFTDYILSQAQYILDAIIDSLKNYDVKYLLVDIRYGAVLVQEEVYKEIKLAFVSGLTKTRIERLARVVTAETTRERLTGQVLKETDFNVPVANFSNVEEALEWLKRR